jgi:S-adenosylmethionine-diacylgycerolhomoserine-N-methlytransferase
MISYALSMIPRWREALGQALVVVGPGGSLHCVDFGDHSGLPRPFKTALRSWLAAFDVSPRDHLAEARLSAARGLTSATEGWRRDYAVLAVAGRRSRDAAPVPAQP